MTLKFALEHCVDCEKHQHHTKHDSRKYARYVLEVTLALQCAFPSCEVVVNSVRPRLGAWELSMRGESTAQHHQVFSKLATGKWPQITRVLGLIRQILECNPSLALEAEGRRHVESPCSTSVGQAHWVTSVASPLRRNPCSKESGTARELCRAKSIGGLHRHHAAAGSDVGRGSIGHCARLPPGQPRGPTELDASASRAEAPSIGPTASEAFSASELCGRRIDELNSIRFARRRGKVRPTSAPHLSRRNAIRPGGQSSDERDASRALPARMGLDAHFDQLLDSAGVERILAIGDCHGSRTLCRLSRKVLSCFHGGSIYSWVSGRRSIPSLSELAGPVHACTYVVVFSYGEIDCRCHAAKFKDDVEMLSMPYAATIRAYVDSFVNAFDGARVVPIVLAVPPATDQGYNPAAPFIGALPDRVAATDLLNASLEVACMKHELAFTGAYTWSFAKSENGALRRDMSDGHVHIRPGLCDSVLQCMRQLVCDKIESQAALAPNVQAVHSGTTSIAADL